MKYNMMWWVSWKQMLLEFHQEKVWSFNLIFLENIFILDLYKEDFYKTSCLCSEPITKNYLWLVNAIFEQFTKQPEIGCNNLLSIYRWVKGNYEEIMNCPNPSLILVTRARVCPVCSTWFDCSEFALNHQKHQILTLSNTGFRIPSLVSRSWSWIGCLRH